MSYKKDLEEYDARRKKMRAVISDKKELAKPPVSVFKGPPQKKRGKANSENNHNKPRGFTRQNKSFTNYMAFAGWTDEELKEYIKTSKVPARFKKGED
jgi:hypothetical protein